MPQQCWSNQVAVDQQPLNQLSLEPKRGEAAMNQGDWSRNIWMVSSWFGAFHQWSLLSWLVYHEQFDTNRWFRGTSISGNHHFWYFLCAAPVTSWVHCSSVDWPIQIRSWIISRTVLHSFFFIKMLLVLLLQPPVPKESGPWWQLGSRVFNPFTWVKHCHKPVCFFVLLGFGWVGRCFGALHLQTRLFALMQLKQLPEPRPCW